MNRRYRFIGFSSSITLHVGLAVALLWQYSARHTDVTTTFPLNLNLGQIEIVPAPLHSPVQPEAIKQVEEEPAPEPVPEPTDPIITEPKQAKPLEQPKKRKSPVRTKKTPRPVAPARADKPEANVPGTNASLTPSPAVHDTAVIPAVSQSEREEARLSYIREIMDIITSHKYYPKRARKRRLQGRVEVSFVVQADGRIESIRLARSSGKNVLDKAALDVLRLAGKFRPLPKQLGLTSLSFVVPLDYQLL